MDIKQLASECGGEFIEEDCDPYDGYPLQRGEILFSDIEELEAFAKAVIKQWVSEQEVVAEVLNAGTVMGKSIRYKVDMTKMLIGTKLIAIPNEVKI